MKYIRHKVDHQLMKSSLVSGTIILTVTGCISRFIGFYYKVFLSRTIGAEGLGIYQLVFAVFALMIAVSSAGIQTAISRSVAGCKTDRQAKGYLLAGLSVSIFLSLLCMFLIRTKADWFCHIMMDDIDGTNLLYIMTWAIPFASIHSCINGYYFGKKKTIIPSVSQLLEQIIRVAAIYLLWQIALSNGKALSTTGVVWGIFIGEFAATLYCVSAAMMKGSDTAADPGRQVSSSASDGFRNSSNKKKGQQSPENRGLHYIYSNLLRLAVPLTVNRILTSILTSAESMLIPLSLRTFGYTNSDALSVYGILTGMVFSTIMFPAVISNSLAVMLLPAVSKACLSGRNDLVRKAVRRTVELCMIFGLICTFGFLISGNWIGAHLFHNTLAGTYLTTLSWICPFIFLGSTLSSILHGLGRATTTLVINLTSSLLRIGFLYFGIPVVGLKAYLWGMLVSQIYSAAVSYLCIRHNCVARTTDKKPI